MLERGLLSLVGRLGTDPRLLVDGLQKVAEFFKVVPKAVEDYRVWQKLTSCLLHAQEVSQTLSGVAAGKENADLVRTRSVVAVATNAMSLLQTTMETSHCADVNLDKSLRQMIHAAVKPMQNDLLAILDRGVAGFVVVLEKAMHDKAGLLAQIAGGAPHGNTWFSTRPAEVPILEWYGKSLQGVATKQLQEHIDHTEAALKELQSLPNLYSKLLTTEPFEQPLVLRSMGKVGEVLQRAYCTRAELFLCATLGKPESSRFGDRLSQYTSELQSKLQQTMWDVVVHPEVVHLIKAGMERSGKRGGASSKEDMSSKRSRKS